MRIERSRSGFLAAFLHMWAWEKLQKSLHCTHLDVREGDEEGEIAVAPAFLCLRIQGRSVSSFVESK